MKWREMFKIKVEWIGETESMYHIFFNGRYVYINVL